MVSVLFVCTGNICRSPTAEGVFRHLLREHDLEGKVRVDSAGTDAYHEGEPPDSRTVRVARDNGIEISDLRARRIKKQDFAEFDYIFAMDRGHYDFLLRAAPKEPKARVSLFLEDAGHAELKDVPDPWAGGEEGFLFVFDLISASTEKIFHKIRKEKLG